MWTSTGVGGGGGLRETGVRGLGEALVVRALFRVADVDAVCESWLSGMRESTCSHSEGDRLVDRAVCLSFLGAPFVLTCLGGGRIEVVSGNTNCRNLSLIWTFML